ncbi:MAG: hypothetical protein QNJ36_01220 [Calothrix sp. MO_167.B42]|nr:hypothetical protein [Calothrix sp. MO_167.B42]
MTNFNPEGDFKDIETWEAIAQNRAGQTGIAAKVIGGVLIGGLGVVVGVEVLGGVVAAWCIKSAWDALGNAGRRLQVARDMGCNAFVLDERLFRTYVRQFGKETVVNELNLAQDLGCHLADFAQDWLEQQEQQAKPLTPTQEVKQINAGVNQENLHQVEQVVAPSIINPIPRIPIPTPTKTLTTTYDPLEDSRIDIVAQVTTVIQNIICIGQGGSGKGILISNAIRVVKERHSKKIFVINGKDSLREAGYFDGVADVHEKLHCETAKPSTVAAWFENAIAKYHQFAQSNEGALLVIDEATIIGARLKAAKCDALVNVVLGVCSCGDEQGKNVWICAQTPFAGANGIDLTTISQMTSIVLIKASGIGVLNQWNKSSLFSKIDATEITKLAANSDCNRAVYWGGSDKFYSMPKLTNHSCFDRDTRTVIKDAPPSKKQLEKLLDLTSEQPTEIKSDDASDRGEGISQELVDCILNKITELGHASFDTLRKHAQRNLSQDVSNQDVRDAIQHLVEKEIISGNTREGYNLI